jgi:hypothetical protein
VELRPSEAALDASVQLTNSPTACAASELFPRAFRFWLKLGLISFGGPTGQIAIMHTSWWKAALDQ